jgi:hypothetical protein
VRKLILLLKKLTKNIRKNRKLVFPIALGILVIAIPLIFIINKNRPSVGADWWKGQENGGSWAKRQRVTITNNSSVTLSQGTTIAILVDTKALAAQGYIKDDCSDLRVVYSPTSTTHSEVSRYINYEAGKSCTTSQASKIYFKLQAAQNTTSSKDNTGYYVYFDNPVATIPATTEAVFSLTGATATIVCPFNGSTTCATGETNTDSTPGVIGQAGSKTALHLSGYDTGTAGLSENAWSTAPGLINLPTNDMTVETWFYWDRKSDSGGDALIAKRGSPSAGWRWELNNDEENVNFYVDCSTTDARYETSNGTVPRNQWIHIATTWNAQTKTAKVFLNGVEPTYATATACVGSYAGDSANTLYIGRDNEALQHFPGKIDEVRISNNIRYASNFTPSTSPFIRDSNTTLLYHFDENGRTPQGSATTLIYDDSGNNYNAVLNIGNFSEGLVGKDKADSDSGYVSGSNTFVGKEGIFVEDGTTNKIPNPSFESDGYSDGWTLSGGSTAPSTTTTFTKFGNKALSLVANDTNNRNVYTSVATGGGTHTLSAYVYRYSTSTAGVINNTVAQLFFNNAAQSTTIYQNIGGGWWRLSYTGTANATDNFGVTIVQDSGIIIIDGVQLEANNLVTSYTDGSLGSGYSWTGTANNSTSSKGLSGISYPASGNISNTAGAISIWVKMPIANTTFPASSYNTIWKVDADGTGDWFELRYDRYTNSFTFFKFLNHSSTAVTVAKAYVPNEWVHLVGTWSSSSGISLSVNNGTAATNSNTTMPDGLGTSMFIGNTFQNDEWHTQFVASDFRMYNAPLSATQITDLYNSGFVAHSQETVVVDRFTNNKGQDPVAIYHFDEGYGTTAHDSSKFRNDLTMASGSAPTWDVMSDPSNSSLSRNLKFNGSGTYAYRDKDSDFNFGSDSFTISGWFRHISSAPTNNQFVIASHKNAGYKVYMKATTGVMCFGIDGDSTWSPADEACSTSSYYDSKWHEFTAIKNGTTSIAMYIDGIQVGTDTSLTANGSLNTEDKLYLGIDTGGTSGTWFGNLDDIQFYSYAKSEDQIKAGSIGEQTAVKLGNMQKDLISEGLVGYWKMDEGSWNSSAGEVIDHSGNGNHGFSSGSTAAAGKFGFGGVQNSSSDYINVGSRSSLDNLPSWTYALWVNPTSLGGGDILMTKSQSSTTNAVRMWIASNNGNVSANMGQSGTDTSATTSTFLPLNTWTHVAATYDKPSNKMRIYFNGEEQPYLSNVQSEDTLSPYNDSSLDFTIGNRIPTSDEAFIGKYDEARVYNRALAEHELKSLTNYAPGPSAYWKLDETNWTNNCSTRTVMDSSGNGYHGNSCPNGTGVTQSKPGKFGNAVYISNGQTIPTLATASNLFGTGTQSFTLSAWVKPENQVGAFYDTPTIIGAQATVGGCQTSGGFTTLFTDSTTGTFYFRMPHEAADLCSGSTDLADPTPMEFNEWHHYTGTYNGETEEMILYKDGVRVASTTWSGIAAITWTSSGYIGISHGLFSDYMEGGIDDVKIYNYVRSPGQVVQDMNAGHPAPGSPIGSAIAEWSFDEGYGDYAYDASIHGNTTWLSGGTVCPGNTTCPTWSNDGKQGKALSFDGGDFAESTEHAAFDISGANPVTVSTWIKTSVKPTTSTYFGVVGFAENYSTGSQDKFIQIDANGFPNFYTWDGSTEQHAVGTTDVTDGNWHHLVGVFTGTESNIYVDGNLEGTISTTSTDNHTGPQIVFSQYSSSTPSYYQLYVGLIDETRIYNQALNTDQVKAEFNQGKSVVFGSGHVSSTGVVSNSALAMYCPPGDTSGRCAAGQNPAPVAVYNFNDKNPTTITDTSGKDLHGTANGTLNTSNFVPGISGSGISLDGINDYIAADGVGALVGSSSVTVAGWFKTSYSGAAAPEIFSFNTPSCGNDMLVYVDSDGMISVNGSTSHFGNTVINDNKWHHIAVVLDDAGNNFKLWLDGKLDVNGTSTISMDANNYFSLGQEYDSSPSCPTASNFFPGVLDEFIVYPYARTASQVAWDMNRGAPFLKYSFEECSGTTIYNTARGPKGESLGLNGTLNITASSPGAGTANTAVGTCASGISTDAWYNGSSGKYGASIYIDETDEYITVSDDDAFSFGNGTTDQPFSIATWIYTDANEATGGDIVSKHNASDLEYRFYTTTNEALCISLNDDSASGTIQICSANDVMVPGTWQHVVATYDGTATASGLNLYVDTELITPASTANSGYTAMENMSVGLTIMGRYVASVTNEYRGKIDELQMFNYNLTPVQIKSIYNNSAAVNFE